MLLNLIRVRELKTFQEVLDEIYNEVDHLGMYNAYRSDATRALEPFSIGKQRMPSTAFCILYKLFTMKLTVKQVKGSSLFACSNAR